MAMGIGRALGMARGAWLLAPFVLTGCGSVEVPDEVYYRVALPPAATAPMAHGGVLRMESLTLASSLSEDGLMVQEGPVRLRPYAFHRWVAPLDQLVTDAIQGNLRRSRCFEEVLGPLEGDTADLVLTGRIVDFQQDVGAAAWDGVVTLDLRLVQLAEDGVSTVGTAFQREFTARVPATSRHPEAGVQALSQGLGEVCQQLVQQMVQVGVVETGPSDAFPGWAASPAK